jgi:hypothetical protein
MAVPARGSAADQEPADSAAEKPGLRADVQRAMMTEVRAGRLAVAEIARRRGDVAALEMAGALVAAMEALAGIARRLTYAEERLEALVAERVAEELAARDARRGRLRPVLR